MCQCQLIRALQQISCTIRQNITGFDPSPHRPILLAVDQGRYGECKVRSMVHTLTAHSCKHRHLMVIQMSIQFSVILLVSYGLLSTHIIHRSKVYN